MYNVFFNVCVCVCVCICDICILMCGCVYMYTCSISVQSLQQSQYIPSHRSFNYTPAHVTRNKSGHHHSGSYFINEEQKQVMKFSIILCNNPCSLLSIVINISGHTYMHYATYVNSLMPTHMHTLMHYRSCYTGK